MKFPKKNIHHFFHALSILNSLHYATGMLCGIYAVGGELQKMLSPLFHLFSFQRTMRDISGIPMLLLNNWCDFIVAYYILYTIVFSFSFGSYKAHRRISDLTITPL